MFDITAQELSQSLPGWGYTVMLALMVIEGPLTTLTAAFLASIGIFDVWLVLGLSIFGDVIGDVIFYSIGRLGGKPMVQLTNKLLRLNQSTIEKIESTFEEKGAKIVFYVKITTGLSIITFILAGTAKMDFKKFLNFSLLGGLVWSGMLVGLGYFFGFAAVQIEKYIKFAGWLIFLIALVTFFFISISSKKKNVSRFFSNMGKK